VGEDEKAVFRVVIRGTIERVWREITKTDELQKCFFNMWLETDGLRPGGQIRMRSPGRKNTPIIGEVLEFQPPHRYVHTFRFTQFDDPPCTVIHELKAVEGGVEYTLTHTNLPPGTRTAKQMNQGGTMICLTLKAVVESGRPSFGVRLLHVLFRVLEPLTPKKCRSENWPLDRRSS
jgi:uncharacterized protein YndB with AHSA1/START domain